MLSSTGTLSVATLGFVAHWCYFIRGEHDTSAAAILQLHCLSALMTVCFYWKMLDYPLATAFASAGQAAVVYLCALFTSISIYRTQLHPLRQFPGPYAAKVSKLYHFWKSRKLDNYRFLHGLHGKYGDFVRTGPNEITIFTADAIETVYGYNSRCERNVFYDMLQPLVSLFTFRSKPLHNMRRKVWDHAYNMKALNVYNDRILTHVMQLNDVLTAQSEREVDVSVLYESFGIDVLGDVSFDQQLGLLRGKEPPRTLLLLSQVLYNLGLFSMVPWMFFTVSSVLPAKAGLAVVTEWAEDGLKARLQQGECGHDPATIDPLLQHYQKNRGEAELNYLLGDFILMFAAGSEPIRSTLTHMSYYLVSYPQVATKLRMELVGPVDLSDDCALRQLPYLRAVIQETMRLHPPVPASGQRITPPQGVMINDVFIPPDTTVLIPQYSLGHSEESYEQPEDFVPERWTSRPDMVRNRSAFFPWSIGPYHCVGKNLGMMEIRLATAMLVTKYDRKFANDEDGTEMKNGGQDCFLKSPGRLRLVFQKRSAAVV